MRSTSPGERTVYVVSVVKDDLVGLERTRASVSRQTYPSTVHMVVDGGPSDSVDSVRAVCGRWQGTCTVLGGPDRGIYHGMNRGLEQVQDGALVWYLNAGDFFLCETAVQTAVQSLGTGMWIGGPVLQVSPNGVLHGVSPGGPTYPLPRRNLMHLPAQPSVLATKEALVEVGGFREDLTLASDALLIHALADRWRASWYRDPLVGFVLGGRSAKGLELALLELWAGRSRAAITPRERATAKYLALKTKLRSAVGASGILRSVAKARSSAIAQPADFCHWRDHPSDRRVLDCCLQMGSSPDESGHERRICLR